MTSENQINHDLITTALEQIAMAVYLNDDPTNIEDGKQFLVSESKRILDWWDQATDFEKMIMAMQYLSKIHEDFKKGEVK